MFKKILGCVLGGLLVAGGAVAIAQEPNVPNVPNAPIVRHIAEKDFDAELAKATTPVVVDFYADWCGPCRLMSPIVEKQAAAFTGKIAFFKVNVDQAQGLANRYGIDGIPALFFFNKGKVVDKVIGLVPEAQLKSRLDSLAGAK